MTGTCCTTRMDTRTCRISQTTWMTGRCMHQIKRKWSLTCCSARRTPQMGAWRMTGISTRRDRTGTCWTTRMDGKTWTCWISRTAWMTISVFLEDEEPEFDTMLSAEGIADRDNMDVP